MKTIAAQTGQKAIVHTVGDVVRQRACLTFFPGEKVTAVVKAMHGHHSGAAGVIDAGGRFIGLITEREILRRLFKMTPESAEQERFAEEGKPILDLTAWDIMIAGPDCLDGDMDIGEALDTITTFGYRYMPVLERGAEKRLIGIVGERELFLYQQAKVRRELEAKDSLLAYVMHHEPYGTGATV